MPACSSGATFDWPNVVFDNAEDAGNAVAVALQNATCTFTAVPVAPSEPPPNAGVRGIELTPLDGRIDVTWSAPAAGDRADRRLPGPLRRLRRGPDRVDRGRVHSSDRRSSRG